MGTFFYRQENEGEIHTYIHTYIILLHTYIHTYVYCIHMYVYVLQYIHTRVCVSLIRSSLLHLLLLGWTLESVVGRYFLTIVISPHDSTPTYPMSSQFVSYSNQSVTWLWVYMPEKTSSILGCRGDQLSGSSFGLSMLYQSKERNRLTLHKCLGFMFDASCVTIILGYKYTSKYGTP